MTTARLFGRNLPCSGGGWFRLLPYALFRRGFRGATEGEGRPGIFYFHPWEVDPGQPRVPGCGWKSRLRHYTNLARMSAKLDRLLADFAWDRMDRVFAAQLASAPAVGPEAGTAEASPAQANPAEANKLRAAPATRADVTA